jgi:hypothetical protein
MLWIDHVGYDLLLDVEDEDMMRVIATLVIKTVSVHVRYEKAFCCSVVSDSMWLGSETKHQSPFANTLIMLSRFVRRGSTQSLYCVGVSTLSPSANRRKYSRTNSKCGMSSQYR